MNKKTKEIPYHSLSLFPSHGVLNWLDLDDKKPGGYC